MRALLAGIVLPIGSALYGPPAYAETNDGKALYKLYKNSRWAGDYAEAERLAKRMLDITAKRFGKNQGHAVALDNLAIVFSQQGRYAEAIPLYKRALEITGRKRCAAPCSP